MPVTPTPSVTASSSGTVAGSGTGSVTGSGTGTGTVTGSAASGASSATTTSISQNLPAGSIVMTQPAQTAQASYYKIAQGNTITFGWNFTDIIVQPSTLAISAVCTDNGYTYTIATGVPGTATSVLWDPYAYLQSPGALQLAQATYTLHINDERGPTALGTPGFLNAYSGLKFALYKPGQAIPLDQWNCPDCSAAFNLALHPGFICIVITFSVMMLSGWGLLRRAMVAL